MIIKKTTKLIYKNLLLITSNEKQNIIIRHKTITMLAELERVLIQDEPEFR